MSREDTLLKLIKLKYNSLRNFSIESNIPNSTLNSMFKKGIGGTSFDTVLKVCSLLGCDVYSLDGEQSEISAEDRHFFSRYLSMDPHSKKLANMVVEHQLESRIEIRESEVQQPKAQELVFPVESTLSVQSIRVYLNSASAGFGEYLEDSDYEDIPFYEEIPANADFGISIHGDSMAPEIADGDVVWVKEQDSVETNQVGVFVLNGDALCKKLISRGGKFFLQSLNRKYKDIPITEYDSLKVIGKVLASTPFPSY